MSKDKESLARYKAANKAFKSYINTELKRLKRAKGDGTPFEPQQFMKLNDEFSDAAWEALVLNGYHEDSNE